MAHEVVEAPGFRQMSLTRQIKNVVTLRLMHGEILTVDSPPVLVRENKGRTVPMTRAFISSMDQTYIPLLTLVGKVVLR